MFIGAVTDLLSVALTAGMFHYGYFMAAIIFGLLSGLISVILNITKKNSFHFTTLSTLAVLAVYASIIIYIMFHADGSLEFPLFGKNFKINKFILLGIVSAVFGSGIFGL
jgi:hypothetical protein